MATFDYAEMQQVGKELIDEFGSEIALFKDNRTPADPAAPYDGPAEFNDKTDPASRNATANAVFVHEGDFEFQDQLGGLIRRGKAGFLIDGLATFDIATFDQIRDFNGKMWKIGNVRSTNPGGTDCLHGVEVSS